ncbi:TPA: LacI family DNA-binding transcriptional regulator [Klebsiella pneumoniae subsp. pneumoniae]|nr:LacI family DNA-binding transcriptional regulator [Klebsiella pneumoniae subsp. pneumoniae]
MAKKINFSRIAELAGVSTTTVSHIFNGNAERHRISDITKKKVLAIATQFADQEHIRRAIIRASLTRTIGVIVPDMSNFSFAMFLHKLEMISSHQGIQIIISCSHYNPAQEVNAINNLLERKVDGIITITSLDDDVLYSKVSIKTPVLLYDRFISHSQLPFVSCESICSVTKLISEKAKLFDEFWFLGGDIQISTIRERLIGFRKGLKKAGLKLNKEWIVYDKYHENLGYHLMEKITKKIGRLPKAIFTPSGNLLEVVLLYLKDNKVAQNEIYLCSYDYNMYHDFLFYDVDILSQDYEQLARHCFINIQHLINKHAVEHRITRVPPKLIVSSR